MRHVRTAQPADLPGTYRVCLLTGDSGRDASAQFRNPDLLGHVYVGPYIVGERPFSLVVADEEGIAGYCLAALDTTAFAAWADAEWWPALRAQYPLPSPGDRSPDAEITRLIHEPPAAPPDVVAAYPSHLHIDLLERARGTGLGRALIERQVARLREHGSAGVHLDVAADNANAIAFYRHLGFMDVRAGDDGRLMAMRLR
jgi:ribosomal protein S18 acetylase RimI-like enzyme